MLCYITYYIFKISHSTFIPFPLIFRSSHFDDDQAGGVVRDAEETDQNDGTSLLVQGAD